MEIKESVELLSVLAHEGRLAVLRLLMRRAPEAVRAGEIAGALGLKLNTASVYLGALERAGAIIGDRRGRAIHYAALPDRVGALADFLVTDCCRGRPEVCGLPAPSPTRPLNVLFLCTGNSARSILAEALLRDAGKGRFRPYSAGLTPKMKADQPVLSLLRAEGHDVSILHPKPLENFRKPDAPRMDLVVTVCDVTANVDGAPWPGAPVSAHWGLPDPAEDGLDPRDRDARLSYCHDTLSRRINALLALPADVDRHILQQAADAAAAL